MKKIEEMKVWIENWLKNGGELRDVKFDEEHEVAVGLARVSRRGCGIGQIAVVAVFRGSESNSSSKEYIYRDPNSQWRDDPRVSWKKVEILQIAGDRITLRLENPQLDHKTTTTFYLVGP